MNRRVCRVCRAEFFEPSRPGRPRALCDAHQGYKRRRGTYPVTCPCGRSFMAKAGPGIPREHCSTSHKRLSYRARKYGLEPAEFFRLLHEAGGRCQVCGDETASLHVDHDHQTGKVRGLLCSHCNLGIGHFRDDPDRLRAAIAYLTA